jgi:hypothetical protein
VVAKAARAAAIAAEEREASGVSVVTGDEVAGASPLKLMSADSGAWSTTVVWLSKCVFLSKRC